MYTLTIPVKPYVKKYIEARYEQEVWEVNKLERIGKVFFLMLERMPKLYEKSKLNLGATLKVSIREDYAVRRGIYVPNSSVQVFNEYILEELIEEIVMHAFYIENRIGLKKYKELYIKHSNIRKRTHVIRDPNLIQFIEKREIIYDILKLYKINEFDLPFETIDRATRRFKLPLLSA